ncbi:MAG: hypothetical protein PHI12_14300 [Dehalococcoidales bacterium]|nr:hypothetical protein [Dehalococcoidales bacterium]
MSEIVVLFDSNEAAQYRTNISGWVSRHGHLCCDERAARYDGCTHTLCEDCSQPIAKGRLVCTECWDKRQIKKYEAMPKAEWNEKGMLYSDAADKYFSDWDEIEEFIEEEGGTIEGLRLIICKPHYLPLLDSSDFGCDDLAEDGELPDAVIDAIAKFNEVIYSIGPVSWTPGNKAAHIRAMAEGKEPKQ